MRELFRRFISFVVIKIFFLQSMVLFFPAKAFAQSNKKEVACRMSDSGFYVESFIKMYKWAYIEQYKRLDKKYGTNLYKECASNLNVELLSAEGKGQVELAAGLLGPMTIASELLEMEKQVASKSGVDFDPSTYDKSKYGFQVKCEYRKLNPVTYHEKLECDGAATTFYPELSTQYIGKLKANAGKSAGAPCFAWNDHDGKVRASKEEREKLQQFVQQYTKLMYEKFEKTYDLDLSHCDKNQTLVVSESSSSYAKSGKDQISEALANWEEYYANKLAKHLNRDELTAAQKDKSKAERAKAIKNFMEGGLSAVASGLAKTTENSEELSPVFKEFVNDLKRAQEKDLKDREELTKNNQQNSGLNSDSIESKAMMSTLTMATIGLLTSRLSTCKPTPDMVAAALAGGTFILGEMTNFSDIKDSLGKLDKEVKAQDKDDYQTQIRAFYKLRDGYKKAIKTSKNKTTLQKAAAFAFAGAAVSAGTMYASAKAMLGTCSASLTASASACSSAAATCPSCLPAVGPVTSAEVAIGADAVADEIPGISSVKSATSKAKWTSIGTQVASAAAMCPFVASAKTQCAAAYTMKENASGLCPLALTIAEGGSGFKSNTIHFKGLDIQYPIYWNSLSEILFPEAKAKVNKTTLLGLGAAATAFVVGTATVLGPKIDTMIYNPKNRAILWSALAGLTYAAIKDTEGVIEQLEKRTIAIDEIIASLKNNSGKQIDEPLTDSEPSDEVDENDDKDSDPTNKNNSNQENRVYSSDKTKSRVNGNGNNEMTFSNTLPCMTKMVNGKCQSAMEAMKSNPSFAKLDTNMQNQFGEIAKTLGPLSGASRIDGATLGNLEALGSKALNAVSNLASDLTKKYKIPKKDVDQIESKKKEMLAAVQGQLKKNNSSPGQMYASFGGSGSFAPQSSGLKNSGENNNSKYIPALSNDFSTASGSNSKGNDPKTFEDLSGKTSEIHVSSAKEEEEVVPEVEMDLNDITKDKEKSIFSIISDRYQKTGYIRLMGNQKIVE